MNKKIEFTLFFLALFYQARAHLSTGSYTLTPDLAEVTKRIDFSAANYTGIVSTTIPLYRAEIDGLHLDLSLNYLSRGIQVEEVASSVGLGWTLNAGGVITRAVKGEPDDFNKAHAPGGNGEADLRYPRVGRFRTGKTEKIKSFNQLSTNYDYIEKGLFDIAVPKDHKGHSYHGKNDTEPDVFYFQCNGLSGRFVFDVQDNGTQSVRLIPYQDVSITHKLDSNGEILSFTVRDLKGNTYLFNAVERIFRSEFRTDVYYNNEAYDSEAASEVTNIRYNAAWHLTKITTRNGCIVNFTYADEKYVMPDNVFYHTLPFDRHYLSSSLGSSSTSNKKRITRITTPHETITFSPYVHVRKDLIEETNYAIGGMEVKSNVSNKVVKKLNFSYHYFEGVKVPGSYKNAEKRLKLLSVSESGVGSFFPLQQCEFTGPLFAPAGYVGFLQRGICQ